ncbi:MAG: toll/interleukin-1 receptor domain-containing protein [Verrucomicrobia bacterium]|nr:toll/interleukin-1 receptor domain-containing protein [Verrucomicrobiota bacterium]
MPVFVSYNSLHAEFVHRDLVPVLRAAGVDEVLIDKERFTAGRPLIGQMDAVQDRAKTSLLVLTPGYLASDYCLHEMRRAVAKDPTFAEGGVLPVVVETCMLPPELQPFGSLLRVHLTDRTDPTAWASILKALAADGLGVDAPRWLAKRAECEKLLQQGLPVNLFVRNDGANWKVLLDSLEKDCRLRLPTVDLEDGCTASREGLIREILDKLKVPAMVPKKPNDLAVLSRQLRQGGPHLLVFRHFHYARDRFRFYERDFFRTLRNLMDQQPRALVPLFQSREPLASLVNDLLPNDSKLRAQLVEL